MFRSAPDSIGAGIVSTAAGSVDAELVAASFVLFGWLIGDDLGATALVAGNHPVEVFAYTGVGVEVSGTNNIGCQLLAETGAAVCTQRTAGVEKVVVVEVVVVRSLHSIPTDPYRRSLYGVMQV